MPRLNPQSAKRHYAKLDCSSVDELPFMEDAHFRQRVSGREKKRQARGGPSSGKKIDFGHPESDSD